MTTKRNRWSALSRLLFSVLLLAALTASIPIALAPRVSAAATNSLLDNPGFEGDFDGLAPGWVENSWGGGADFDYAPDGEDAHGGWQSQRLDVFSLGDGAVQFYQSFSAQGGESYEGSVWLRADEAMEVEVLLRRVGYPYSTIVSEVVSVGSGWTQVVVNGSDSELAAGDSVEAGLFVVALSTGSLHVDDAGVSVGSGPVDPPVDPSTNPGTEVSLASPGFEGSYDGLASGWVENSYGAGYGASYSSAGDNPHSGGQSQRMTVPSIPAGEGAVQFFQSFAAEGGADYRAAIWLRSEGSMQVRVSLRYVGTPYLILGFRTVTVGTGWTKVTLQGGDTSSVEAGLFVEALSSGTLYIDDASVTKVVTDIGGGGSFTVPSTLFGMTMNSQKDYQPNYVSDGGARVGLMRFHDTGLRWNQIEPGRDNYRWGEFDRQVNDAQSRGIDVMYTMGFTPDWASARPNEEGLYGAGEDGISNLGISAEPADFADWVDYVDVVSSRYAGRIAVYEVWNEVDLEGMFTGDVGDLIELSRLAYQTIKANDPNAVVLAPNFTQYGITDFEQFLEAGGDAYVDGYGVHLYSAINDEAMNRLALPTPEAHIHTVNQFQAVLDSRGISKEIWITEGAVVGLDQTSPTRDERLGAAARAFLIPLMTGQESFAWYTWEGIVGDDIQMFEPSTREILEPGVAFASVSNWMAGATVISVNIDAGEVYQIVITKNGETSLILWKPDLRSNTLSYVVPSHANTVFNLDGSSQSLTTNRVLLGPSPIRVRIDS